VVEEPFTFSISGVTAQIDVESIDRPQPPSIASTEAPPVLPGTCDKTER